MSTFIIYIYMYIYIWRLSKISHFTCLCHLSFIHYNILSCKKQTDVFTVVNNCLHADSSVILAFSFLGKHSREHIYG